jgi:hypothetical protein
VASLLLAALGLLAAWLALAASWSAFPVEGGIPGDGFSRLSGVVHVHTTRSDGGGTPEEVVAAAKAAGLGFVVITDHNTLDAKPVEGYRDGVLVVVGTEISTTAGHVLAFGIPDPTFRFSGDALDALDDVRVLGGFAFAAHPGSPRPDFRWEGFRLPGAWGLELLNGDSQWREAGWLRLLRTAALYTVNHRYALLRSLTPPDALLAKWDALLARRDAAGIVGADAHQRLSFGKRLALRFPSYASVFGLARNHVLLDAPLSGEFARDARAVLEALARGRAYVALDALAPADGLSFTAEREGRVWTMGDTVPAGDGLHLRVRGAFPRGTRLRLLHDGKPAQEQEEHLEAVVTATGVYRVEARLPGWAVPWVLTNPIYVFWPGEADARAAQAAWPEPSRPPAAAEIIDSFDGPATAFAPESDPASTLGREVVDAHAGEDGRGAARLAFRLAAPAPERPYVWCALVERRSRDFSGRSGLVFSIRADGVYRLWVQVRDENPASADGGTEWWFASLRTSPEWRRITLPFARLRSVNPNSDGRLDLDKVRELVFVIDPGADKPGTQGTIWIDELGVY